MTKCILLLEKVTGNKKIITSLRTYRPWEGKENSNMELSDMYLGGKKTISDSNNLNFMMICHENTSMDKR